LIKIGEKSLLRKIKQQTKGVVKIKEYKVLTQKDKWFSSKFDPETLEKAVNAYADQGGEVMTMATAEFRSTFGKREELIVLMERAK